MEEQIKEETQDNPIEEKTIAKEETQIEEKETPKEKTEDQYTDREKQYYARMKKAEEDSKKYRDALKEAKLPISDIDAILEVQSATRELDHQEISELKLRATAGNMSLSEARKDPNYLLWQEAYRVKVEKENAAKPSTLQPEVERSKTLIDELRDADTGTFIESMEKKAEILEKKGLWKNPRRRQTSQRIRLSPNQ